MKFSRAIYGLNLAELIVAIVIMSLAVITIAGMFISGIMGMRKGDNLVLASNLARSTMDLYEDEILTDFNKYSQSFSPYKIEPDVEIEGVKFKRTMTIKDSIDAGHPQTNRLKYVEITVSWFEKNIEGKMWTKPTEIKYSTCINNYMD